jgi:aspartate aminotransferase
MVAGLNEIEGVYCPNPKGAFYTVVKLPIDDSDKFAQWILEEFEYNKQTVMMAPATGFYNTPGLGKNEVRIAYVLKIEDLKNAIETLKHALEAYPGRVL